MNKSELEHVWHSVTSVLENEFRTRGWLPPHAARIEALEAALRRIAKRQYDEPWDVIDIARAALNEGPSRVETVATNEHLPSSPSDAGCGKSVVEPWNYSREEEVDEHLDGLSKMVHEGLKRLKMGETGSVACSREYPPDEVRVYVMAYGMHKNKWFETSHDRATNTVIAKRIKEPDWVKEEEIDLEEEQ